jgi:hypothetical protein
MSDFILSELCARVYGRDNLKATVVEHAKDNIYVVDFLKKTAQVDACLMT